LRLLILQTEVDYNGRCETPVGIARSLRPRRLAEEAQLSPHGKGATWSCNQLTYFKIATIYTKIAKDKNLPLTKKRKVMKIIFLYNEK